MQRFKLILWAATVATALNVGSLLTGHFVSGWSIALFLQFSTLIMTTGIVFVTWASLRTFKADRALKDKADYRQLIAYAKLQDRAMSELAPQFATIKSELQVIHTMLQPVALEVLFKRIGSLLQNMQEIQGIAEHTRLLAINATTDAAQVGEPAREMAKIASEVEALAAKTAQDQLEMQALMQSLSDTVLHVDQIKHSVKYNPDETIENNLQAMAEQYDNLSAHAILSRLEQLEEYVQGLVTSQVKPGYVLTRRELGDKLENLHKLLERHRQRHEPPSLFK